MAPEREVFRGNRSRYRQSTPPLPSTVSGDTGPTLSLMGKTTAEGLIFRIINVKPLLRNNFSSWDNAEERKNKKKSSNWRKRGWGWGCGVKLKMYAIWWLLLPGWMAKSLKIITIKRGWACPRALFFRVLRILLSSQRGKIIRRNSAINYIN